MIMFKKTWLFPKNNSHAAMYILLLFNIHHPNNKRFVTNAKGGLQFRAQHVRSNSKGKTDLYKK